ncbi:MAG: cytidylate kinase-like family protein [Longicatena sp.]
MEKKTIIIISREFGSGGREIGRMIAEQLNIPFYDKEVIELAARDSGLDKELFEENDTRTSRGFRFFEAIGSTLGSPAATLTELSLNDRLFIVQSQVIENIAEQGSCVIIGRCADYVLADNKDALSVFIHADMKDRKERAIHSYEVDDRDIESSIKKIDKRRANYYGYYTDRKWGQAKNYDVCINSSTFGIERTVEIIKSLAQKKVL